MKSLTLAALAFAGFSSAATAHTGPHDDVETVSGLMSHVLGSPDHASWLILGLTAILMIVAVKAAIRIAASEKTGEKR